MKRKKKARSYFEIPENFTGFTYKEVKIRRAMLELKRDALTQSMKNSLGELKKAATPRPNGSQGTIGSIYSAATKGVAVSSGKLSMAVKLASVGYETFKFVKKFRDRRKAKKQKSV